MYRRFEVFMGIIVLGLMGTIHAILFISMFTFTGYDFFSQGLSFLLVGGFLLFTGIIRIQRAKARGEHIQWWKRPVILSPLCCGCLAVAMLARQLIPVQVNMLLRGGTLLLFFLLSYCLFIYGTISMVRQQWASIDLIKDSSDEKTD